MADIIQNPPEWFGVDTRKANEWIDNTIKPVAQSVDEFFQTIIGFEQFLQEILDFAITFLQGIKNPLIALIQAIIDSLRAILNDLSQAGFYFTLDSALKDASSFKEISKFEGGYSRFKRQLTEKLTNPKDLGRPNFSELTGLLTITAYASSDVDDWIATYNAIIKFCGLFKIESVSFYTPPVNISSSFYKTRFGLKTELTAKEIDIDQQPEGLLLKWSLPSVRKSPVFPEIKAPPNSFLITISTRATPLMLVIERQVSSSTSGGSTLNTIVEPLYLNPKKNEVATTLLLSEMHDTNRRKIGNRLSNLFSDGACIKDPNAEIGSGQYKIYATDYINSPLKISLEKLKEETHSFRIETGVFGVVFTGSDYKEEFSYRELPKKLYDRTSDRYSEDISKYYISICSVMDVDGNLQEMLFPKFSIDSQYVSKTHPSFSIPIEHKAIDSITLTYINAVKEALTRFLVYEKTLHSKSLKTMQSQYSVDRLAIERIYSLFNRNSSSPVFKQLATQKPEKYCLSIKEKVDGAVQVLLSRGLPEKKDIERILEDLKYFTEGRLGPKGDYYFYKSLSTLKNKGDDGIYADIRLGDEDYKSLELREKETWFKDGISSSFRSEGDTLTHVDEKGISTPLFKKGDSIIYPILESELFGNYDELFQSLPSKKKEIAVGESEWKFVRFFGKFPELEEFLEKIESFLLSISKALAGFIEALIEYINLIKQRIASLMAFIARIKAIIDMLLDLRLPDANIKFLITRSRGTLGFVEDLSASKEQPLSGSGVYSTYATLVFGSGLPKIAEDFILGFFTPDKEIEQIE